MFRAFGPLEGCPEGFTVLDLHADGGFSYHNNGGPQTTDTFTYNDKDSAGLVTNTVTTTAAIHQSTGRISSPMSARFDCSVTTIGRTTVTPLHIDR